MTNAPSFHSDEEIINRLQTISRDYAAAGGGHSRHMSDVREVRDLVAELAARIYDDPEKWGTADMLPRFRDDAAADAFMALLVNVPDFRRRQDVSDWFTRTAESKFRRLWSMAERQEQEKGASGNGQADGQGAEASEEALEVFEANRDVWQRFEGEFPRDAFALRLRYMLNRDPEQMAVMLDAPSPRAIAIRINRARDRFRMFCEQTGLGKREVADVMEHFAKEPAS